MKAWSQGVQYAYRYARHKFDAFQAFGPAGATASSIYRILLFALWLPTHPGARTTNFKRHSN